METMKNSVKWIAGGAMGAMLVANGVLFQKVGTLQSQLSGQRAISDAQIAELRETSAASATAMNQSFQDMTTKLQEGSKSANDAAQRAAASAITTAQKRAEQMVARVKEEQQASEQNIKESFSREIGEVRTMTDAKVTGLESSVGSVKQNVGAVEAEVRATKSTLDQTIADLKSTRGDLGVQSGLIATNSRELSALRELGERTYYEFTLTKKGAPVKAAGVVLEFKKVDTKRNKYTVQVMADDKRIEKKDKTVNEPVQLYVGGARQPYEIVVNQVKKDTIVGYVAVPKVLRAAR
jgi:hypothetical protein